jgi:hypothetical protein
LIKTNTIDAFFAVPAQAFQSDFNDNYARYQQASEKQAMQGRQSLMAQLRPANVVPVCAGAAACHRGCRLVRHVQMGDYAAASVDCAY